MRIRSLLLAGAVFPFTLSYPALAFDSISASPEPLVLAQADADAAACPEDMTPAECRRYLRRQQREQEAPAEEQTAPAQEPAAEQPAAEQAPTQQQEPAPAQTQAAEEPAAPAAAEGEEELTPQQRRREERRRQRELERQQQEAAPAETPAAEEPAAPAAAEGEEELTPQQRRREERRRQRELERQQQEAPAADQAAPPAAEAPAAEPAAPADPATPELTPEQRQRIEDRRRQRQEQRNQNETDVDTQNQTDVETQNESQNENQNQNTNQQNQSIENNITIEQPTGDEPVTGTREDRARERARRRAERQRQREEQQQNQPAPAEQAAGGDRTTTEQQLEAQGDRQEADRIRRLRERIREQRRDEGQEDGQENREDTRENREDRQENREDRQENREDAQEQQEDRAERREDRAEDRFRGRIIERRGDRVVVDLGGGRIVVRSEADFEVEERLLYGAEDVIVEYLPNQITRTVIVRANGVRIITDRNEFGDIVRRVRRSPQGREIVLINNVIVEEQPQVVYQPVELPPLVINIPQEEYVVDYGNAAAAEVQEVLVAPPVERVERAYSVEEVTTNVRVRDKMRRIDLDTITFEFGSAVIDEDQMDALDELGLAMEEVIAENPDEVYLIEGHTDAVGSDEDNLILSDERAEAVAVALSQNFEIPPENLVTEGYGEQYLKVETEAPERENRRVTVRRITPLLTAEAQ